MEWQTILFYGAAVIMGLAALKFSWDLTTAGWRFVGVAATTLAVGLQIGPGLYAGDRALAFLSMAQPGDDARKIDQHREKVRKDIIARATMFNDYPHEVARVNNYIRGA